MKSVTNAAMNNGTKKPYTKPELQVYGDLAQITNASKGVGKKTDGSFPNFNFNRTH
jgi:hypothetical protein